MKKILLVALNAKYIHSNPAVYCLKAYAAKYQEYIEIAEYTINQQTDEILRDIYRRKADVIAFSCYIWNIIPVLELVGELGQIVPHIPLFLGGPEVSYNAEELLESHTELTGILVGEGEEVFSKLVAYYVDGLGVLEDIAGLVCKEQEKRVLPVQTTAVFDKLPFLYGNAETGSKLPQEFANRILYYESSRGCPFSCSYCLSSIDKKVRFRELETVKKELAYFLENQVAQVKFIDRTFNAKKVHAMAIWQFLKEHDNGVTGFHFEIGADLLGEEELALLTSLRAGQVQLEIGVQTTNPDTLKAICRHADMKRLKENVLRLQKARRSMLHLDLIAGLPYEDLESFKRSFDEVYSWQPDELQLGFLKVLKGSPMHDKKAEYRLCYKSVPPYEVLSTKWLSYEDICVLKGVEEMLELYYNSKQFVHSLRFLSHFFSSSFAMYEAIAAYYEAKGYDARSLNRLHRYEILEQFVCEESAVLVLTEEQKKVFRELLVYDLYLREKVKSRPDFAGTALERKEQNELLRQMEKELDKGARLHVEAFLYDREAAEQSGTCIENPHVVLFEYAERDTITLECRTSVLNRKIRTRKEK